MTKHTIRKIIRTFAAAIDCKYRITSSDEVHFYGPMPNSGVTGWYFIGFGAADVARQILVGER